MSVKPRKRKPGAGRPPVGSRPMVMISVYLPKPDLAAVDRLAKDHEVTRSDVIRAAIEGELGR